MQCSFCHRLAENNRIQTVAEDYRTSCFYPLYICDWCLRSLAVGVEPLPALPDP